MKNGALIVFLSIVLSIHLLVNLYIYIRGHQALEAAPQLRTAFKILMLFLTLSYPLGRYLEKVWIGPVSDIFHWTGALWFAGMLYAFMFIVAIDITRIANYFIDFLPTKGTPQYAMLKYYTFLCIASALVIIVSAGFINAWHPRITHLHLQIDKEAQSRDHLRIVAASDIHMGTIIARRKSSKFVKTVNEQNPDIILLAGDILDEDVQPVIRQNLGECLLQLKAPLGTFAVTGNHEYIGGIQRSSRYITEHGIQLLRDTTLLIDDSFYLSGREDRDMNRFDGMKRKTVFDLLKGVDKQRPIIMLDHQPYELNEKADAGVDFQLSGHTHYGQLWPWGYLTDKIFEVSHGYKLKQGLHVFVSTGFGTWGPPVRIGNRPEIVVIDLQFTGSKNN